MKEETAGDCFPIGVLGVKVGARKPPSETVPKVKKEGPLQVPVTVVLELGVKAGRCKSPSEALTKGAI